MTGMDLAQATRAHTGRRLGIALWIATELAIMATDVAEVIGAAIALHLLFGLSLIVGVCLTVFDVLVLLLLMRIGFRKVEAIVATLIVTIVAVFVYEVALASPDMGAGRRPGSCRRFHTPVPRGAQFWPSGLWGPP